MDDIKLKNNFIYYLGLIFVSIVWGVNFGIARWAMETIPAEVFVVLRFALAVPILFIILKLKEGNIKVEKRDLIKLVIVGLIGVTMLELITMYSIKYTTLANASLLNVAPWPIFVALFAPLFTREKMTLKLAIGGLIALTGVSFIILGGDNQFDLNSDYMLGNMLALSISLLGAIFNLACMPLMDKYSPLRVTTWYMLFGSFFLILLSIPHWTDVQFSSFTGLTWAAILYNVIICSVLAFLIWNVSMKKVGATKSNFFRYFVPTAATISGVLFFNESIAFAQIIGGIIIIIGLAWIAYDPKQKMIEGPLIDEQQVSV